MRKLFVFNQVTLEGYFADVAGDMSFAHKDKEDAQWNAFVADNAKGGGLPLFGGTAYELMVSSWPTPYESENDPIVAERMNNMPKVVFSTTMFDGIKEKLTLKLTKSRTFGNGNVLLCCEPMASGLSTATAVRQR